MDEQKTAEGKIDSMHFNLLFLSMNTSQDITHCFEKTLHFNHSVSHNLYHTFGSLCNFDKGK